jgi:hypothetical protein
MGRVKEQMLWRSEHATDWEEDLPTWYQYHERELDQVTSDVIIYNVSYLISALYNSDVQDVSDEDLSELMWKVDESFEEEGAEPTYSEALEHWIVTDWFGDELKKRGEMVGEILNLTIWGRTTSGQAISMDYVVQDVLKDIVERRKANG